MLQISHIVTPIINSEYVVKYSYNSLNESGVLYKFCKLTTNAINDYIQRIKLRSIKKNNGDNIYE